VGKVIRQDDAPRWLDDARNLAQEIATLLAENDSLVATLAVLAVASCYHRDAEQRQSPEVQEPLWVLVKTLADEFTTLDLDRDIN